MKRLAAAVLLCAAFGSLACATTKAVTEDDEDAPDTDQDVGSDERGEGRSRKGGGEQGGRGAGEASVSVRYAKTAKGNWVRGEREFADENWAAAQKYYSYIRSKFPYSSYAAKAELRLADTLFERGRYIEAIDAYQNFARLHPGHPQVAYAMFKTARCHYEQIPGDWFMVPPSEEKDQASVRDAAEAFRAYVERYPNDENIEKGRELYADVKRRLVAHERYVADFYRRADKPKAYLGRLEVIKAKFADVAVDDALLLELVEAYAAVGRVDDARTTTAELKSKFPQSKKIADAEKAVREAEKAAVKKEG